METKYPIEEMAEIFRQIQNEDHWKNPISAIIATSQFDLANEAIMFYTGTKITKSKDCGGGLTHIIAPGYWAGPCN